MTSRQYTVVGTASENFEFHSSSNASNDLFESLSQIAPLRLSIKSYNQYLLNGLLSNIHGMSNILHHNLTSFRQSVQLQQALEMFLSSA